MTKLFLTGCASFVGRELIRVCDQRGKQMRFVNAQGVPDAALEYILRQRVVSLALVTPPKSSAD